MPEALYVSNLSPECTEGDIRELFAPFGPVAAVEAVDQPPESQWPDAMIVYLEDAQIGLQAQEELNGTELDGRRLAVSWLDYNDPPQPTDETWQLAAQIAEQLEEEPDAQRRVERVVRYAGIPFTEAIVQETLEIEAAGGMLTQDGERRRTPGGVFFYLTRGRVSKEVRKRIFYFRKPKKKKPASAEKAEKPASTAPGVAAPPPAPACR
ncbi:MAG: hypothetical protein GYB65_21240, partial [Chloroflexi bacterium]|nr:hypothetical protein [Chloroflexota bacterium]